MTQNGTTRSALPVNASGLIRAFSTIATLMVASASMMAQSGGGATLVGTVKDSSGSVVGQAKVTVINTATNFTTEILTAADGSYYVPYLTPGDYRVKVAAPGFKEGCSSFRFCDSLWV